MNDEENSILKYIDEKKDLQKSLVLQIIEKSDDTDVADS